MSELECSDEDWYNQNSEYSPLLDSHEEEFRYISLPTDEEIIRSLMLTGDSLTKDFRRLKFHLDRIAPVRSTYTITTTPAGFAPEQIREQWVGLTLPMRGYFDPQKGVAVLAREALELLKDKSPSAYEWWCRYYESLATTKFGGIVDSKDFPEFLANISHLVFDINSGEFALSC